MKKMLAAYGLWLAGAASAVILLVWLARRGPLVDEADAGFDEV